MQQIQFDAVIKDGYIKVPEQYSYLEGQHVHVVISIKENTSKSESERKNE